MCMVGQTTAAPLPGTAVGALARLVSEATRRGVKWIAEKTKIHRDRRGRAPPGVDPALG